jgi:AraC family transcriptional regulator, exoenzyme S synthesis regulatory protein ExsA
MILAHHQFDLFDKMIFERVILEAPFKIPNLMPNEACFLYVLEGEQRIRSAISTELIGPNDAVLMKCGIHFTEWLDSHKYKKCEAIAVHLYPEVLKEIYKNEIPDFMKRHRRLSNDASALKISGNRLVENYVSSMKFYFENPQLADKELIIIKLKELILLLTKTEKSESFMQVIDSLFSPKEYAFRRVIEAHSFSNLTVKELAQLTNLSLSSFKREFNRIFDASPAQYFREIRMRRAADLLSQPELRISDIAYECGFDNPKVFSTSFQAFYNCTPSVYRLSQKGKSLS